MEDVTRRMSKSRRGRQHPRQSERGLALGSQEPGASKSSEAGHCPRKSLSEPATTMRSEALPVQLLECLLSWGLA